ncbi:peptidase T [Leptobacterium sp. I13]|uniref:peptidase T n=1 Tax=Leptobacterium meishanense TaxID=3128904 RepID=UPI0030EF0CDF
MQDIIDRFIRYVKIDTQSDPNSKSIPSTKKQWDLAHKLVLDLMEIGMQEVTIDDKAYIMATLPSNVKHKVPVIGFISHFDTTPDYTGTNVKPQIISDYDGKDIVLNKKKGMVLSPDYFEDLKLYEGQTLITTDGTTLLGADDKAGITEIIEAMKYLIQHPEVKHGKIRIAFTPDEEIGRGAHHFDVKKFGADWAYTMDGSRVGELEYENFNAAGITITIKGKSVHPGYAKGKMVNAILILNEFLNTVPGEEVPQLTEGKQGFFHFYKTEGGVEKVTLEGIIRDHDHNAFEARKKLMLHIVDELNKKYPGALHAEIEDQYYNMREKIAPVFHIVETAKKAMKDLGIKPIIKPIRGGTDGSQLSYMGLPCPNIFAGGHNFHGPYEYVPVESMEKAIKVIVRICELTAENATK